ncbi:cyanophycinase, partial [Duganella sp. CY42W]|nr:cyanophycinase [Duganella levis]
MAIKFLLHAALLLALPMSVVAADGPKGSLVIIGGGLRADNDAVWQRIVRLPSARTSAWVIRAWSPPEKNTPPAPRTASASNG